VPGTTGLVGCDGARWVACLVTYLRPLWGGRPAMLWASEPTGGRDRSEDLRTDPFSAATLIAAVERTLRGDPADQGVPGGATRCSTIPSSSAATLLRTEQPWGIACTTVTVSPLGLTRNRRLSSGRGRHSGLSE
jgi:hypothetical protein